MRCAGGGALKLAELAGAAGSSSLSMTTSGEGPFWMAGRSAPGAPAGVACSPGPAAAGDAFNFHALSAVVLAVLTHMPWNFDIFD